jgi:hypothetical protein
VIAWEVDYFVPFQESTPWLDPLTLSFLDFGAIAFAGKRSAA